MCSKGLIICWGFNFFKLNLSVEKGLLLLLFVLEVCGKVIPPIPGKFQDNVLGIYVHALLLTKVTSNEMSHFSDSIFGLQVKTCHSTNFIFKSVDLES